MDDETSQADAIIQDLPDQIARVRAHLDEARSRLAPQSPASEKSEP